MLPLRTLVLLAALVAPPPPRPTTPVLVHKLVGHTGTVRGADFSPDHQTLATVGDDGQLRLWDAGTGKAGASAKGQRGFGSVEYSRDGKMLVTAGTDNVVRLWHPTTARELKSFAGHTGSVYVAAFTPDAKMVVSVGLDPLCRVWDVATGKQLRTMTSGNCYALAVSPDGKYAVTAGERQPLTLWDLASGKEVRQMPGHTGVVVWLAFSPDGRTIASSSYDNTIRLWETRTGKERVRIGGVQNSPRVHMFSTDGRFLAAGNYDFGARLYDVGTGKQVFHDASLQQSLYGVAISRDGRYLAGGAGSGKLQVWDVSAITWKAPAAEEMTKAAFDSHWNELGSEDAAEAYKGVVALSVPGALKHFTGRFAPPKPLDPAALKKAPRLIKDLDSDDEDRRKKAMDELAGFGPGILPTLKAALEKEDDPDVKLRLMLVIRRADVTGSEELRILRLIEVLERVGTAESAKVLEEIASHTKGKEAASEAKATLARLRERRGKP